MIRCDKCGIFYDELTHNNCPKCGEKKHQSVGKCMLCGKEAERGDVCNKCIKDYQIKAEEIAKENDNESFEFKRSKGAGWLQTMSGFTIVATVIALIALACTGADVFIFVATLLGGTVSAILLGCYAEHLEYMEHMARQLEEIKEIIKLK